MDYNKLTEEEILAALDDENEDNPIVLELTRIMECKSQAIGEAIRQGKDPLEILDVSEDAPLMEQIAVELLCQAMADAEDEEYGEE